MHAPAVYMYNCFVTFFGGGLSILSVFLYLYYNSLVTEYFILWI